MRIANYDFLLSFLHNDTLFFHLLSPRFVLRSKVLFDYRSLYWERLS